MTFTAQHDQPGELIDQSDTARWAQHFGIGEQRLVDVVAAVGPDAHLVRAFLEAERTASGRASAQDAAPKVVDMTKPIVGDWPNHDDADLRKPDTVRVL